jgi:S1-C subfamily serine protease
LKKWSWLLFFVCLSGLLVVLLRQTPQAVVLPAKTSQKTTTQNKNDLYTKSRSMTVKILSKGEFLGSGVLIRRKSHIYTIVTNDHVLRAGDPPYQIQTFDGKTYQAIVKLREQSLGENDLALLEFVSKEVSYSVAKITATLKKGDRVWAAGFPAADEISSTTSNKTRNNKDGSSGFTVKNGKVFFILDKPLEGGYQVGYSSKVEKGMSGGPLINAKGELVGINGMHAYPLWGDPYIYKDGSHPEKTLWEQMNRYSWGIPIKTLLNFKY